MFDDLTLLDWRRALDAAARRILDRCEVVAPPVDALALAAALGYVVATDARQQSRGRCARLWGGAEYDAAAILLRPEPRGERRQWAVAHEIGEQHAHEVFDELGLAGDESHAGTREQTANELANRLLLPTAWFLRDGRRLDWDLVRLKRRYATASYELIARRMLDADVPAIVTILDHGSVRFRGSNLPGRVPGLSRREQAAWSMAHESSRTHQTVDRVARVRAWPIHEPHWKREIVRTDPAPDCD